MTQKEFIEVLDEKGYSYKIEGDKIIVEGGVNVTVYLRYVTVKEGSVDLTSLTSLPSGVEFRNGGNVYFRALKSLPPGVEFRNKGNVFLWDLIGGYFHKWKGNIKYIDSKSLLNLMIKRGMFI